MGAVELGLCCVLLPLWRSVWGCFVRVPVHDGCCAQSVVLSGLGISGLCLISGLGGARGFSCHLRRDLLRVGGSIAGTERCCLSRRPRYYDVYAYFGRRRRRRRGGRR
eukprot:8623263-Alexandrium_andersonii.AAC.1